MREYAIKARAEGIRSLKGLPDQPLLFQRLLDEVTKPGMTEANVEEIRTILLGILLISEGNNPELIETLLRREWEWEDIPLEGAIG